MVSIPETSDHPARRGGGAASARGRAAKADGLGSVAWPPFLVTLFMLTLVVPIVFEIAGLRLGPYRLLLMAIVIPLLIQLLTGKAGRMRAPDGLVLFYGVWIFLSLVVNHGMERLPYGVITAIEAVGPYLIGRLMIRDAESFAAFVRLLLVILAVLLPFSAYEALTGSRVLSEFFDLGFRTYGIAHQELRWGMTRAQTTFEHPILFGVFASTGFMLAYYVLGALRGGAAGKFWTVVAGGATFFSLSMGAFLSGMVQVGLWAYDHLTRSMKDRWKRLIIVVVSVYIFVDVASNRGPVVIFIQNAAFNPIAAWQRIAVWDYGTDVVMRNPLFGIGLSSDWHRPHWVTSSVDNFWLANGMKYGLPAVIALIIACLLVVREAGRREFSTPLEQACRKGYLIVMAGLAFSLCTVHAWNAVFCYVMFLVGAGAWMMGEAEGRAARSGGRRPTMRQPSAPARTARGSVRPDRTEALQTSARAASQPVAAKSAPRSQAVRPRRSDRNV